MATFTVNTVNDVNDANDGLLSLREAIQLAYERNGADEIVFAAGINEVNLRAAEGGDLDIYSQRLTINGDTNGDGIGDVAISANNETQHFFIYSDADVTLANLALEDGSEDHSAINLGTASTGSDGIDGYNAVSSIYNNGTLTLDMVTFDDNTAKGGDGQNGGTGERGVDGPDGADGADGTFISPAQRGGDGGDGTPGENGFEGGDGGDAATVLNFGTIVWRDSEFGTGNVADAGDGGVGGRGGAGGWSNYAGDGGDGFLFADGADGGNGGDGARGGTAGTGGKGGAATSGILNYGVVATETSIVDGFVDGTFVGGLGGSGGVGGSGGLYGIGGSGGIGFITDGADGTDGSNGAFGAGGVAGSVGDTGYGVLGAGSPAVIDGAVFVRAVDDKVAEGDRMYFNIHRSGDSDTDMTVAWSADRGDKMWKNDFKKGTEFSGEVTFEAGGPDVVKVWFKTKKDFKKEGQETMTFNLDSLTVDDAGYDVALTTVTAESAIFKNSAANRSGGDDELLLGTNAKDVIKGYGGDDVIVGRKGGDTLKGGTGDDVVKGQKGYDKIFGGKGEDILKGNQGKDILNGGKEQDILVGGKGNDKLTGGRGEDIFRFNDTSGADVITDFFHDEDMIEYTRGPASFADLDIDQNGDDVMISYGDASILVKDQFASDFTASDFIF